MKTTGATTLAERAYDVAVVGGGPAGMSAAVTAGEAGLRVVLIDAAQQLGGQYWRHPDERVATEQEDLGQHDWSTFTDLRRRLNAMDSSSTPTRCSGGEVRRISGHQAWFVEPSGEGYTVHLTPTVDLRIVGSDRPAPPRVETRFLVLCPGGYDRQLPVPGWDLPGVMAAGGVQALLKAHRSVAGRRAIVAGTGPFLMPVAVGLAEAGAHVLAVCEAGSPTGWARSPLGALAVPSKALEAIEYAKAFARHRIPIRTRTAIAAISGDDRVESVRLTRLDRNGHVRPSTAADDVDVDLVALGWGFTPSLELVAALGVPTRVDVDQSLVAVVDLWQRTVVERVYVAGEATGVGGAALSVAEGELAGLGVCGEAGWPFSTRRARSLQRTIRRGRAFAAAMHRAHPIPDGWREWLRDDTVVCRCEEVTFGEVCAARDTLGATDARTIKLLARPGMGWCQGRVCGFATAALAAERGRALGVSDLQPMVKRSLAAPVSLAELAGGEHADDTG